MFSIYERLKKLKHVLNKDNVGKLTNILKDLNKFKNKNYFDFNAFMQFETHELSGGVGLLYVETTFDNVYYNKILKNNQVKGFEVVLEKKLVKQNK